ncbi:MAG TPA: SpoIIE family protein phosphatase [Acidimicrobiales bacterium]|nr:SpoIIE family protein phosphatase [Acidimicrobiales bacterium]
MALTVFEATGDDAQSLSRVRRFVAEQVRALGRTDLVDDAVLVASELAANAVLHAGGITAVLVGPSADGVRVEIHDQTRVPPMMARKSLEAMTGRGLRLVDSLSARWAAEPSDGGKVVWAELAEGPGPAAATAEELLDLWDDDVWAHDREPARHRVSLGDVPTSLLLAAKSHVDNLVREFTLAAQGARSGVSSEVPPHLAPLIEAVVTRFAEARQAIKRQALAAADRGLPHVRLELTLPAEAADAGEEYLRALDEADSYCHAARLLTLETPPQHRVFRHWYVGQLVAQLRAAAAGSPPPPVQSFEDRLLHELDQTARAQKSSERAARLYQVSAALSVAATPEAVASAVLEQGVAALGASGGGLLLATAVDRLVVPATMGYDDEVVERLRSESRDAELPAAVALRTGAPVWLETREERDRRFPELTTLERGTVSVCAVPLLVGERRLGALQFSFRQPRLFDEDERRFVLALAAQTAQALDRAQLYEQHLEFSRRLQLSLLPQNLPRPPHVEIAGVYQSLGDGTELGGDIYDVWPIRNGRWGLAIADVAGTGPEAAAMTAVVRFTLRALTVTDLDPVSVLTKLHRALLGVEVADVVAERFCTGLFGVLYPGPTSTVALAGAGHPAPIVRRGDGRVEELPVGGSLLGVFDEAVIGQRVVTLEVGDTLVLYTDGAVEARRAGVMFGLDGVMAAIRDAPDSAAGITQTIARAVLAHTGGVVGDDLAALAVRVTG